MWLLSTTVCSRPSSCIRLRVSTTWMGVDADGRLVQHQHFGLVYDGLRDTYALPEPLGELPDLRLAVVPQPADVNHLSQPWARMREPDIPRSVPMYFR